MHSRLTHRLKNGKNHTLLIRQLCAVSMEALKDKVRITPIGEVTGIDGRYFNIDGKALLKDLKANGLDLPLSKNHSWDGEALGWFSAFEIRGDGLYATLNLNASGEDLITRKAFKYLSPEYLVDFESKKVFNLNGVGLVSKPNLLNEALNQSNQSTEDNTMSEDEKAEMAKLKQDNNALQEKVTAAAQDKADLQIQLNTQMIDSAITAGELLPAKKDFALTLDVNSLTVFLKGEQESTIITQDNNIDLDADTEDSDKGSEVYKQLGL